jgi:hypothetical protein
LTLTSPDLARTGKSRRSLALVFVSAAAAASVIAGFLWVVVRPNGSDTPARIRLPHATLRLTSADQVELMVDPEPEALEITLAVSASAPSELHYNDLELTLADGTTLRGRSFSFRANDPDSLYRALIPAGESTVHVGFQFSGAWVQPVALRLAGSSGELQITSVTRRPPD